MATGRTGIIGLLLLVLLGCTKQTEPEIVEQKGDKQMHRSVKRGVAFNFVRTDDAMLLSPYISWYYNWGNAPGSDAVDTWFALDSVVYYPMAWSAGYNTSRIEDYTANHPKSKYLLAFNEPNLKDQANMTPQRAAEHWPQLKEFAAAHNLLLVSPAMNYGTLEGYHDPVKWLDEFFACDGVSVDDVVAIAVHCYMSSPEALKNFIYKFEKYNKPVWLTEFCAWDPVPGDAEAQMTYMCSAVNFLEQCELVEKYAWFIPRSNGKVDSAPYMQLLTHTSPSELTHAGKIYCALSSQDTTVWLDAKEGVAAIEYVNMANNAIQIRYSEQEQRMMVYILREQEWLDYQVVAPNNAQTIELRYSGVRDATALVYVDGQIATVVDMPKTGDMGEFSYAEAKLTVAPGKHTMRIEVGAGAFNLVQFKIQ